MLRCRATTNATNVTEWVTGPVTVQTTGRQEDIVVAVAVAVAVAVVVVDLAHQGVGGEG